MIKSYKNTLILVLGFLIINSCASKKDVLYFNDVNLNAQDATVYSEGKIQTNDILSVIISSSIPELAAFYNTNHVGATSFNGYLVTIEGYINLPILGKIGAKGLTVLELEKLIVQKLIDGNQLSNPTVSVRLTNAKFTILGEVKSPGTYNFNEQSISLLQALGYAGDLTINGKRQDVLIIREENNKRTYTTIDLTSKRWFDSPNYYIKPNDVIYVNPNGPKVTSSGYVPTLTNLLAAASIAITTIILLTR